jgi:uncharacterized protein
VPLLSAIASPELSLRLAVVAGVFFLGGTVKGVLGFGMPSVVMACLGLMMPPQRAAALMILPALITNVWQVFAGPAVGGATRRCWPLLVAIVAGTAAGLFLLGARLGGGATVLLGSVLAAYSLYGLITAARPMRLVVSWWMAPAVGVATGLLNSATGISVMPLVPYLGSLGLEKEDLVQTLGLCFLVAIIALGIGLTFAIRIELSWAEWIAPLMASLAGMATGQAIRLRISAEVFRRYFFVGLGAMGAYMVLHAL